MGFLARWLGQGEHDGAAGALEAVATGLPASVLNPEPGPADRRRRTFEPTRQAMVETVAKQVLRGWLQNRHQTLLPLTVNFRLLSDADARLLVETMAAGLLTGSSGGESDRAKAMAFLASSGASDAIVGVFLGALTRHPPLHALFEAARQGHGLSPLAYILLVVVNDMHVPANALFLQWAAAKLELPTTVVRSVERRYRR